MPLALPLLLCIASGFALVSLGWSRRAPLTADLLLRGSLSIGYGLGMFSVILFLARVYGITNLIAVDLTVFAALLVSFLLLRTRGTPAISVPLTKQQFDAPQFDAPPWLRRILTGAFAIALFAAVYSLVMRARAHPHGDGWDAFSIWNLHARFLFRAGLHWRDGFSPLIPWSHPDYPLLLPGAIAHFWTYLGHDDPTVPAVIGLCFTFSTVGLLFSALSIMRGRTVAMLGGLTLLTTPFFIEQGASQYADVPLSFFFLATIVLLCLHDHDLHEHDLHEHDSGNAPAAPGLLVLAGLAAGFSAWTKNEGLLFLCSILAARLLILIHHQTRRGDSREPGRDNWIALALVLAGAGPAFLLIAWFKHSFAPPGDLFSDPAVTFHKLLAPANYWAVVKWYVKGFFRFGHWLLLPGTLLLIGFYFAANKKERSKPTAALRSAVLALALTLAGYFAIYLISPYDIYWHLHFSLTRLFLQLWPSAIFLFFLSYSCGAGPCGAGTLARVR